MSGNSFQPPEAVKFIAMSHHEVGPESILISGQGGSGKTKYLLTRWYQTELPFVPVPHPPRFAEFCLLLVPLRQREGILGDLQEEFSTVVVPKYGATRARLYYVWQVLVEVLRAILNVANGKQT